MAVLTGGSTLVDAELGTPNAGNTLLQLGSMAITTIGSKTYPKRPPLPVVTKGLRCSAMLGTTRSRATSLPMR